MTTPHAPFFVAVFALFVLAFVLLAYHFANLRNPGMSLISSWLATCAGILCALAYYH